MAKQKSSSNIIDDFRDGAFHAYQFGRQSSVQDFDTDNRPKLVLAIAGTDNLNRFVGVDIDLGEQRSTRSNRKSVAIQKIDFTVGRQTGECTLAGTLIHQLHVFYLQPNFRIPTRLDFPKNKRLIEIGEIEKIDTSAATEDQLLSHIPDQSYFCYIEVDRTQCICRCIGQKDGNRSRTSGRGRWRYCATGIGRAAASAAAGR